MPKMKQNPIPSKLVYWIFHRGLAALFFSFAFSLDMIYFYETVGMDPLQMILVGTALESSVLLFEIPTGVLADVYSRKLSILIGYFLIGLGLLLQGVFPSFAIILMAQLVWGLGFTFTSGAIEAWLSEEIGEEEANESIIMGTRLEQLTSIVGIALAAVVMPWNQQLPLILGGIAFILMTVVLIFVMKENGFVPTKREGHAFQQMKDTFLDGLQMTKKRPVLKSILLLAIFFAIYTEGFDRLWIPFALDQYSFAWLEPEQWIGGTQIVAQLMIFFVLGRLQQKIDLQHNQSIVRILIVLTFILFGSLLLSFVTPSLGIALLGYGLISIVRGLHSPFYLTWVNHRLEPSTRATVLSLSGQLDAVGQIVGGPMIGSVARRFSIRSGLGLSTLLLSPALWLITRPSLRAESEEALPNASEEFIKGG